LDPEIKRLFLKLELNYYHKAGAGVYIMLQPVNESMAYVV